MEKKIIKGSFYLLALVLILSVSGTVFADDLLLPSYLTSLEAEAFMGDTSLDNVIIPSGVTAIKARTFANSSLRSITIPSSVRSVAADAFAGTDPEIYVEDINSLSGNLTGTVHLTGNSTISSSVSYSDAELIVEEGASLTVTGTLQGTDLEIYGTVINRGTLRITNEINTSGSGLLSVQDIDTTTELPYDSFYGGLNFNPERGIQFRVTSEDDTRTVTAIGPGRNSAEITTGGQTIRFCFVPSESNNYTIASFSDSDTYVHLLDASGRQIAYNDDGGDGSNFRLTSELTAGTVYFYDVRYYNDSKTGTILFGLATDTTLPIIKSHPADAAAQDNQSVSFSIKTAGSTDSYQWQIREPEAQNWEDTTLSGYNTDTLSFIAQSSYNGCQFRCVVTGQNGFSSASNPAVFHFVQGIMQLGDNTAAVSAGGQHVMFSFTPGISGSYTLTSTGDDDTIGGLYDASLTQLEYDYYSGLGNNFLITYDLSADTVYYYSVCFYDESATGTIPLILRYDAGPKIIEHPLSITTNAGDSVSFSVTADGTETLTYQWQELAGESLIWQNSTGNGNETSTLSFTAMSSHNNTKFRCIVTDVDGFSTISSYAVLRIQNPDTPTYRALLIAETNFAGEKYSPGHHISVENINYALENVTGPDGGIYQIYGGDNEFEDADPTQILSLISSIFGHADENDVSLFFINSHGDSDLEGLLAGKIRTVNSDPDHTYRGYSLEQHLLIDELAQAFSQINGKVIIWIDTCGSGAGIYAEDSSSGRGQEDFDSERFTQYVIQAFANADEEMWEVSDETGELRVYNKFYVITASAYHESSYSNPFMGDYLSQAIKYALTGYGEDMPADTNEDGIVTQEELYRCVYDWLLDVMANWMDEPQHAQRYPTNSDYALFSR